VDLGLSLPGGNDLVFRAPVPKVNARASEVSHCRAATILLFRATAHGVCLLLSRPTLDGLVGHLDVLGAEVAVEEEVDAAHDFGAADAVAAALDR